MFSQLGPMEICCDAPPYPIVQECERLGFQTPLDVRWCRLSHFLQEHAEPESVFSLQLWRWFFGKSGSAEATCTCGQPQPLLKPQEFTMEPETVLVFLLGQCGRCRTIFWEVRITHLE